MLPELIIALLVIVPIITYSTLYVIEYRDITSHKKEMDEEWIKYSNEPMIGNDRTSDEEEKLF